MSEGKRITYADIMRQMELASKDIETWPTWMRRAAGLDGEGPDYETLRDERDRLREALEQIIAIAKPRQVMDLNALIGDPDGVDWNYRMVAKKALKAALTPAAPPLTPNEATE